MAASFARRLSTGIRSTFHLFYRFEKSKQEFRYLRAGISSTLRTQQLSHTGTGLGVTLGFLGFSFGKKNDGEDDEVDVLTRSYRSARLAHNRQHFEKADELYHECLKIAEDQLKKEEITKEKHLTAKTLVFDGLADIALKMGQIEMAQKLFIETMKGCLNQGMDTSDNVIIEISLKLSSIYAMQGKKEESEEGYKFCVHTQSQKLEALEKKWMEEDKKSKNKLDHPADEMEQKEQDTAALLGMALGSYGRFLLHERRYQEALPLFERAVLYAKHTLGTSSNQYIVVLNDLATLHIVSRNYDKAENILNDGIIISEKAKLSETALLYCNLGAIHLRRGQPQEASKTCQTGLSRAKEFDHPMAFRMAEACIKKSASVQAKT